MLAPRVAVSFVSLGLLILVVDDDLAGNDSHTSAIQGNAVAEPIASDPVYWVYAVAESQDEGYVIRFDGKTLTVEETVRVGLLPAEVEGPHAVHVSPEGAHWYVSFAHGAPRGFLRRFETGTNRATGQVELDMFPSSLTVDALGMFVFVANSNFHGDMVPSGISMVFAPEMIEAARIETCTMPHGSRLNRSGTRHYSTCMMDDQLVELDVAAMAVSRRFGLASGGDTLLARDFTGYHAPTPSGQAAHADHHAGHGGEMAYVASCSPTWAQPSPDERYVYAVCNRSAEIVVIDLEREEVSRRVRVPERPYNLDVTPNGRTIIVTHRRSPGSVTLWDAETWEPFADLPTGRSHTHGITITPDSRFVFITSEGVRGESGTVDVVSLESGELVDRVHVGRQAGGIAFWKMDQDR